MNDRLHEGIQRKRFEREMNFVHSLLRSAHLGRQKTHALFRLSSLNVIHCFTVDKIFCLLFTKTIRRIEMHSPWTKRKKAFKAAEHSTRQQWTNERNDSSQWDAKSSVQTALPRSLKQHVDHATMHASIRCQKKEKEKDQRTGSSLSCPVQLNRNKHFIGLTEGDVSSSISSSQLGINSTFEKKTPENRLWPWRIEGEKLFIIPSRSQCEIRCSCLSSSPSTKDSISNQNQWKKKEKSMHVCGTE